MEKFKPIISVAVGGDLTYRVLIVGRQDQNKVVALAVENELRKNHPEFQREIYITEFVDEEHAGKLASKGVHSVIFVLNSQDQICLSNIKKTIQMLDIFLLVNNAYVAYVTTHTARVSGSVVKAIEGLEQVLGLPRIFVNLQEPESQKLFAGRFVRTSLMKAGFLPGYLPILMRDVTFTTDSFETTF